MNRYCTECGNLLNSQSRFCPNCGTVVGNSETPTTYTNAAPTSQPIQTKSDKVNGFGIAGLVVSILSILTCCGSISVISLILSIVGLKKSDEYGGKGLSIAGIIVSIIGIVLVVLAIIFFGFIISTGAGDFDVYSTL